MNDQSIGTEDARRALETMRATQAGLASLAACPPWRHAAFGAIMGLLVFSIALPQPWQVALFVIAMASVVLIVRGDRRRHGFFVNGYRRGATRPLTFSLLAVMLGLDALQVWLSMRSAPIWVSALVALTAFVGGVGASLWWSRIFRREMERAL